jgi:hypothetical protein
MPAGSTEGDKLTPSNHLPHSRNRDSQSGRGLCHRHCIATGHIGRTSKNWKKPGKVSAAKEKKAEKSDTKPGKKSAKNRQGEI